jgi:hypothetical protein
VAGSPFHSGSRPGHDAFRQFCLAVRTQECGLVIWQSVAALKNKRRQKMKKQNLIRAGLMLICIPIFGCLFPALGLADDEHWGRNHFEREDQHSMPFLEADNEGNETAGQIAAWLLLVANFPVVLSILIKGINRFILLGDGLKNPFLISIVFRKNT